MILANGLAYLSVLTINRSVPEIKNFLKPKYALKEQKKGILNMHW
jgi:hypothetical protein